MLFMKELIYLPNEVTKGQLFASRYLVNKTIAHAIQGVNSNFYTYFNNNMYSDILIRILKILYLID